MLQFSHAPVPLWLEIKRTCLSKNKHAMSLSFTFYLIKLMESTKQI